MGKIAIFALFKKLDFLKPIAYSLIPTYDGF
jgi:hypothetical protein